MIGKNAVVEVDGAAFWLSPNGFFMFDGTVKSLPCSVEDFVYDNFDTTKGQQVTAGINNLFTEVRYYPSASASYNDKYVVFNYGEPMKGGVWYTVLKQEQVGLMQLYIQNLLQLNTMHQATYVSSSSWSRWFRSN